MSTSVPVARPLGFPAIVRGCLRVAAGPLILTGFFLPWAHGPGPLAATEFTGFTLVGFAGRLQQLDLSQMQGSILIGGRIAILLVAVAALWLTLLAPAHRWHPMYHISGYYLATFAVVAAALGIAHSGIEVPPTGLGLLIAGALAFLAAQLLHARRTE